MCQRKLTGPGPLERVSITRFQRPISVYYLFVIVPSTKTTIVGFHRFVAPFPGIDKRLRLRPVFAALIVINLEIIALRIERRVDVAEVDAFGWYLAAQDVEIVAVVEFVFWHARSPDTVWAELVEALPFLAG